MRYGEGQEAEYEECLEDIGAWKQHQEDGVFVMMSKLPESLETCDWNLVYHFSYDKMNRVHYDNPRCPKRLVDAEVMSREELARRAWHKGDYPELVVKYFRSGREEVEQERRVVDKAKPAVEDVKSPQLPPAA